MNGPGSDKDRAIRAFLELVFNTDLPREKTVALCSRDLFKLRDNQIFIYSEKTPQWLLLLPRRAVYG